MQRLIVNLGRINHTHNVLRAVREDKSGAKVTILLFFHLSDMNFLLLWVICRRIVRNSQNLLWLHLPKYLLVDNSFSISAISHHELSDLVFISFFVAWQTCCFVRPPKIILYRGADIFLFQSNDLINIKLGWVDGIRWTRGIVIKADACTQAVLRHLVALEHAWLITTLDKTGGQLCCLYEILSELAFDHLMLHLLQDWILGSLKVLNQHFLALLRALQALKLLD